MMGKLLKSKKMVPDIILSSSAIRAKQTAQILIKTCHCKTKIKYLDSLYMAEPSEILTAIEENAKDEKTVMVIGHNPGMEAFVQILNGKVESLPTSSIAYLTADVDNWKKIAKEDVIKLKKLWRPKDIE